MGSGSVSHCSIVSSLCSRPAAIERVRNGSEKLAGANGLAIISYKQHTRSPWALHFKRILYRGVDLWHGHHVFRISKFPRWSRHTEQLGGRTELFNIDKFTLRSGDHIARIIAGERQSGGQLPAGKIASVKRL
jgi:hypothetical protein